MDGLIEFVSSWYLLYWPELWLASLWHADWESAYKHEGIAGIAAEFMRSLLGANTTAFSVPMGSGWSIWRIQRLLAQYGIAAWGDVFANHHLVFRVKKRQAEWAQYVMLRDGVPLSDARPIKQTTPRTGSEVARPAASQVGKPLGEQARDFSQRVDSALDKISSYID